MKQHRQCQACTKLTRLCRSRIKAGSGVRAVYCRKHQQGGAQ